MNTVLEKTKIENAEKEQHNAMINERYRQLLDAVEDQFSTLAQTEYNAAPAKEETPAVAQTPSVKEYTPSALASSLFTAERFERIEELQEKKAPEVKAVVKAAPTSVAQYSLTPLAKAAMAIFTLLVIAMLALIGINSQIIQRKSVRLKNLEEQKQELMEQNEEIKRYIEELQTEESIIQRAIEAGLLN